MATHLPSEVDPLDPAANEDLDDCICARFTTLDTGNASRPLWRCDITWARRPGYRFSVAGGYDDELLRYLQHVKLLLLVEASVWDWWQLADAYLVVPNDRDLWLTCKS